MRHFPRSQTSNGSLEIKLRADIIIRCVERLGVRAVCVRAGGFITAGAVGGSVSILLSVGNGLISVYIFPSGVIGFVGFD